MIVARLEGYMGCDFSIIVPLYNGNSHISGCLESILAQSYRDIELIVVDDHSSDGSCSIVERFAQLDERVRLIALNHNGGTLFARKTGVLASNGSYVLLVDQDDELVPGALERLARIVFGREPDVDIVHFGVKVVSENEAAAEAAKGMLEYVMPKKRELYDAEILQKQFSESDGFDWNVHHKAYRGDLARKAWGLARDERLTLSDDLYVSYILSSLAKNYIGIPDLEGYVYHLGRGETFGAGVSLEICNKICDRDIFANELVKSFAAEHKDLIPHQEFSASLQCVAERLVEHAANELADKLPVEEWAAGLNHLSEKWDDDLLTAELFRLVRDRAYDLVSSGGEAATDEKLNALLDAIEAAGCGCDGDTERGASFRREAILHLHELGIVRPEIAQHINIFVTTHKDVYVPPIYSLTPVQVGKKDPVFPWAAQDDGGDNIASLNPYYCELTTQYWAWKNVKADYYGFCHYRRYFNFSKRHFDENPFGEIIHPVFDAPSSWLYGMTDEEIEQQVEGADAVTTQRTDLVSMPGDYRTPLEHYADAPHLRLEDLLRVLEITKEMHPDYSDDIEAYAGGTHSCFCNMFIMKAGVFSRYCGWLFPILERFMDGWDKSYLSHEALRTPGHLAERLLNIFLMHEQRVNPDFEWRTLQCVHFEQPERAHETHLLPTQGLAETSAIPVVFAADNNYVPMVTTTIRSMLCNASPASAFDIVVLERDISRENKQLMTEFFSSFKNARIRFADVSGMIRSRNLQTNNPHISIETYYRFLIQDVLPAYDKVLYLDSDLVMLDDIAKLFNVELADNLVAATRDIDYAGNLNMTDGKRRDYSETVLHLRQPFDYFQAGVLVLNLAEMRKLHSLDEWLALATDSQFIYDDQDILNSECQGRVFYLDQAWNVMTDCDGRIRKVFSFAPAEMFDAFMTAYADPKIVHYAGYEKPWNCVTCDKAEHYWEYARQTPFYEKLLFSMCADRRGVAEDIARAKEDVVTQLTTHERAISEDSPIRGVADAVLPPESRRREMVKGIVRKLRGRR